LDEYFSQKLVLIGNAEYGVDKTATPFARGFPGIGIHATMIDNILRGNFIRDCGWRFNTPVLIFFAGLMVASQLLPYHFHKRTLLDYLLRFSLGIGIGFTFYVLIFALFYFKGLVLDVTLPLLAMGLGYMGAAGYRYVMETRGLISKLQAINEENESLISELRDVNEKLQEFYEKEEKQRKAEWAATTIYGLAHNLRNKADHIFRDADFIDKELNSRSNATNQVVNERLHTILERSHQMVQGFERLLKATGEVLHEEFNLANTMDVLILQIIKKNQSWRSKIEINKQYADNHSITADRQKLKIVFEELITNACEAMEEKGGTITIQMTGNTTQVLVAIQDTGKGIPVQHLEEVFRPRYTTKKHGTGFGLWIAQQIIEGMHQGKLSIRSKEGNGTTVFIQLPTFPSEPKGRDSLSIYNPQGDE
jgi:signal transduction histidine kinase